MEEIIPNSLFYDYLNKSNLFDKKIIENIKIINIINHFKEYKKIFYIIYITYDVKEEHIDEDGYVNII